MNTDLLARTTFVLDLDTHEKLQRISVRLGVSRSSLVRRLLTDPVHFMDAQLAKLPVEADASMSPEEAAEFVESLQLDLCEFIDRLASEGTTVQ